MHALFSSRLTTSNHEKSILQTQEMELLQQRGSPQFVNFVGQKQLNYLQIRTLRNGLEQGIQEAQLARIAKRKLSFKQMEQYIAQLSNGQPVALPSSQPTSHQTFLIGLCIVLATTALGLGIMRYNRQIPTLRLKQRELRVEVGQQIDPSKYIEVDGKGTYTLRMSEGFVANTVEHRLLIYTLHHRYGVAQQVLPVQIVDTTPPKLQLKQKEVSQEELDSHPCSYFVLEAQDQVDGDLKREVQCWQEGQLVHVEVQDGSNNQARTTMQLVEPRVIEEEENLPSATQIETPVQEPIEPQQHGYYVEWYEEVDPNAPSQEGDIIE